MAADLASAEEDLCAVLGLAVSYRDPVVGQWGLENAVLPVGNDFLEIVSPVAAGTSAGRYLERRDGDSGYMVILHSADAVAERERITALGVRAVHTSEGGEVQGSPFHPRDLGGVLLSIHSVAGEAGHREAGAPWPYAGENWQSAVRTEVVSGLAAVEMQNEHPLEMAELWARVLDLPLSAGEIGGGAQEDLAGHARWLTTPPGACSCSAWRESSRRVSGWCSAPVRPTCMGARRPTSTTASGRATPPPSSTAARRGVGRGVI